MIRRTDAHPVLPDVLRQNGRTKRHRKQWESGRAELLHAFATEIYGAPVPVETQGGVGGPTRECRC